MLVIPRRCAADGDADAARRRPGAQAGAASAADAAAAAEPVDITMFLDDYRAVDGVLLPHHISRSIDGKPTEEWTFKTIKINPAFKPDTFTAK